MKKQALFLLFLAALTISSASKNILAQDENTNTREYKTAKEKADMQRYHAQTKASFDKFTPAVMFVPLTIEEMRRNKLEEERLRRVTTVSPNDAGRFEDFLKQKYTGIFRLFPNNDCEVKNLVKVGKGCQKFIPGAWAYSFRHEDYSYHNFQDFYDIAFNRGQLVSDGFLTQGILVSLGDINFESISLDTKGVGYLHSFAPAASKEKANEQYELFSRGIEKNGLVYSNRLQIVENNTYVLRSIAYKYKDGWASRLASFTRRPQNVEDRDNFLNYKNDKKRHDIIVAFKIVRVNDRGLTLIWKRLVKKKSPVLRYKQKETLKDFKN